MPGFSNRLAPCMMLHPCLFVSLLLPARNRFHRYRLSSRRCVSSKLASERGLGWTFQVTEAWLHDSRIRIERPVGKMPHRY
jgi:hypothetical protein